MPEIKKIVCAVDLSERISPVIDHAVTLAKLTNASVVVVYAVPSLSQYRGFLMPSHDVIEDAVRHDVTGQQELKKGDYTGHQLTDHTIDSFVATITAGAQQSMDEFLAASFKDVEAKGIIAVGDAAEKILEIAKEENANLIIMGTRGLKGLDRFLVGSVAEKVVRKAPCPVMTVHPRAGQQA